MTSVRDYCNSVRQNLAAIEHYTQPDAKPDAELEHVLRRLDYIADEGRITARLRAQEKGHDGDPPTYLNGSDCT